MKERPILFSAPMVRAILAGTKTQTRRVIESRSRLHPETVMVDHGHGYWPYLSDDGESECCNDSNEYPMDCPYGQPGDRLWVRETFAHAYDDFFYKADGEPKFPSGEKYPAKLIGKWKPSIHMPRWASRITLEITGVRVERLQDISEQDALAEGIELLRCPDCHLAAYGIQGWGHDELNPRPVDAYRFLSESINGAASWPLNPWVWVIEFKNLGKTPEIAQDK